MNQMWILKNSKELLEHIKSQEFQSFNKHEVFRFFYPLYNYTSR